MATINLNQLSLTNNKGIKMNIREMMKDSKEIVGEQEQLKAVKEEGYAIQFIHNPSEAVQIEAVKQNGNTIQFIHNPSESVQMETVIENGYNIQWIHNPSEAVQIEAVKQNGNAIQYFKQAWLKDITVKRTVS